LKISKEVLKRLEAAEKKLDSTKQVKYAIMDFGDRYFGDCGFKLSQEQFDAWVKEQGTDTEITILRYTVTQGAPC
jgi:hypothetical protein